MDLRPAAKDKMTNFQELHFGRKPWLRFVGLLGGTALTIAGAFLLYFDFTDHQHRRHGRGVAAPLVLGIAALWSSFSVRGLRLRPDGVNTWSYRFWIIGGKRFHPGVDIKGLVLGDRAGDLTLEIEAAGGQMLTVPKTWTSFKTVREVAQRIENLYGVRTSVRIQDKHVLSESLLLAKAQSWQAVYSRKGGRKITFSRSDGSIVGTVRLPFFRSAAEISDAAGLDRTTIVRRGFIRTRWEVRQENRAAGSIQVRGERSPKRRICLSWTDPSGVIWSATKTMARAQENPIKFYRGLAGGTGTGGSAELVAVMEGLSKNVRVDVVDESAWRWIGLATAIFWTSFH